MSHVAPLFKDSTSTRGLNDSRVAVHLDDTECAFVEAWDGGVGYVQFWLSSKGRERLILALGGKP